MSVTMIHIREIPRFFTILTLVATLQGVTSAQGEETLEIFVPEGSETIPSVTPFAMSYYPSFDGMANDSVRVLFAGQLVSGTSQTADRIVDTRSGAYAYQSAPDTWAGTLLRLLYGRGFLFFNRHDARLLLLTGIPADSATYMFPFPAGSFRVGAPRMSRSHGLDEVGLSTSGFHWSENMRLGGDIAIDMNSRAIARRDSSEGWIGTLDSLRLGQPLIIQVNHPLTFDWTYLPGHE